MNILTCRVTAELGQLLVELAHHRGAQRYKVGIVPIIIIVFGLFFPAGQTSWKKSWGVHTLHHTASNLPFDWTEVGRVSTAGRTGAVGAGSSGSSGLSKAIAGLRL